MEPTQCFKTHTVNVYKAKIKDFLLISMRWHDLKEEIPTSSYVFDLLDVDHLLFPSLLMFYK